MNTKYYRLQLTKKVSVLLIALEAIVLIVGGTIMVNKNSYAQAPMNENNKPATSPVKPEKPEKTPKPVTPPGNNKPVSPPGKIK